MKSKLKMTSNNVFKNNFIWISIIVIGYIIYLVSMSALDEVKGTRNLILLMSWLGLALGCLVLVTWKRLTGLYFAPYTIFMLFFFLFNYGQCLMWAFGIHVPYEIGASVIYSGWGVPTDSDILKTQLYILTSALMFHCGAVLFKQGHLNRGITQKNSQISGKVEDSVTLNIMFKICFSISLISFPLTIYHAYSNWTIAQVHGYRALYYSEFASSGGSILTVFPHMFFVCIVGMLIGSKFDKKIRFYTYSVFYIFIFLNVLSGDRGSWVYILLILIWFSHFFYKNLSVKKIVLYVILSIFFLYVLDTIVSLRNSSITFSNVISGLSISNSPMVETIFEMGTSMSPTMILQMYNWNIWPYENSYLLSVLTMITNKVLIIFNIPFETIGSWFSQTYLGISYGAGFSIVAEALMNFGPYVAPFAMLILGKLISSVIYVDKFTDYKSRPLRVLFAVATLEAMVPLNRGYFHYQLKEWFYGAIIISLVILSVKLLLRRSYLKKGG